MHLPCMRSILLREPPLEAGGFLPTCELNFQILDSSSLGIGVSSTEDEISKYLVFHQLYIFNISLRTYKPEMNLHEPPAKFDPYRYLTHLFLKINPHISEKRIRRNGKRLAGANKIRNRPRPVLKA